ncbi:KH domain-containing protein [Brevifollis gellanilyticus]|uniref:Uncharacterized protein n=1 Tax=Brevifollis gellanilyticus TaxID=748831 RepID=A0A512MAQ9_9BACT|nr:KH domain-containing protein [Brevifollis gellanilyticus]GEP43822.1 hypothetical protein BGE01nite_31130 [Brevifollis gellanilyticus]
MDAPEALREFLAYIVANLIDHPQQATIAVGRNSAGSIVYRIQLAQQDVRHVIGKNGLTVSSIRSLLNTAAEKHGLKVSLRVGAARDLENEETPEQEQAREAELASDAENTPAA